MLKETVTIYPVSTNPEDWKYYNNKDVPFVNKAKGPMKDSWKSDWQNGVFNSNVTPKTYWKL